MSKIIKSMQSYSNDHLFTLLQNVHAQCMTWHVDFVRSKDAQKKISASIL